MLVALVTLAFVLPVVECANICRPAQVTVSLDELDERVPNNYVGHPSRVVIPFEFLRLGWLVLWCHSWLQVGISSGKRARQTHLLGIVTRRDNEDAS